MSQQGVKKKGEGGFFLPVLCSVRLSTEILLGLSTCPFLKGLVGNYCFMFQKRISPKLVDLRIALLCPDT